MTERSQHIDFDELMRALTVTGFVALSTWVMASSVGVISGYVAVSPPATLRFLLAVLILVFARRTYWEVREWRWGKLPPDERFGFSNPLAERPRTSELGTAEAPGRDAGTTDTAATGSPHPRA
ncbi:MAG TPA: hypothetical protein VFI59_01200 [Actinomycetota bacterium]|nr:hypothetical protein [Actinomycetota bacterium]